MSFNSSKFSVLIWFFVISSDSCWRVQQKKRRWNFLEKRHLALLLRGGGVRIPAASWQDQTWRTRRSRIQVESNGESFVSFWLTPWFLSNSNKSLVGRTMFWVNSRLKWGRWVISWMTSGYRVIIGTKVMVGRTCWHSKNVWTHHCLESALHITTSIASIRNNWTSVKKNLISPISLQFEKMQWL